MTFEGVTFNHLYWVGKTLQSFIKHEGHHGLTMQQLEEAFFIMNPGARVKLPANDNKSDVLKGKVGERRQPDKTGIK